MPNRLLPLRDVAELVNFTPKTLRKWIAEGKFPAPVLSPGGDHRWHEIEVLKWIWSLEKAEAVKQKMP